MCPLLHAVVRIPAEVLKINKTSYSSPSRCCNYTNPGDIVAPSCCSLASDYVDSARFNPGNCRVALHRSAPFDTGTQPGKRRFPSLSEMPSGPRSSSASDKLGTLARTAFNLISCRRPRRASLLAQRLLLIACRRSLERRRETTRKVQWKVSH